MRQKGALSILLLLLALLTVGSRLDEDALEIHDASFKRAISAFAIAKGLNAVISVLQGTEFNATPAGLGVTITVGQVLDPMNDLIERFSWVMLVASVSLGIQSLLLSLGDLLYLRLTLVTLIALLLIQIWYRPLQNQILSIILVRLGIVLLLLRFGALIFVYAQSLTYTSLMEPQYEYATQTLASTQKKLEDIIAQDTQSLYETLKRSMDISTQLTSLKTYFDHAQKEVITLISMFLILTILLPLLFMWIMISLLRWTYRGKISLDNMRSGTF